MMEETEFLLAVSQPGVVVEKAEINPTPLDGELKIPQHSGQESVEDIISERQLFDDHDVDQQNIREVTNGSEENLVNVEEASEKSVEKSSENG